MGTIYPSFQDIKVIISLEEKKRGGGVYIAALKNSCCLAVAWTFWDKYADQENKRQVRTPDMYTCSRFVPECQHDSKSTRI